MREFEGEPLLIIFVLYHGKNIQIDIQRNDIV
jgi:hypothetical protein